MSCGIITEKLTKKYKSFIALDSVDLHIEAGSVYGLIGRNGAGKTTMLKIIAGLTHATSGNIVFTGTDGRKAKIGVLIEEPGLYPNLSAAENLKICLLSEGVYSENEMQRLLSIAGLSDVRDKKVRYYSLGMRQRLGIILALAGDPDILLLDEPMNGLDPQGIVEVRNLILKIRSDFGKTIILSSHILEELQKVASTFGILENGRLISESTEKDLSKVLGGFILLKADPLSKVKEILDGMGIYSYQSQNNITLKVMEQVGRADEILKALVENDVHVYECSVLHDTIEDYFMNVTGGSRL